MKKTGTRNNLILSIIITAMVFVMLVTSSFAWFYIKDRSKISFTVGSNDITLYTASYQGEEEDGRYEWSEAIVLEQQDASFGSEYEATYLTQFGTLDNLSFRNKENNFWFCLKINKMIGNNFSLKLSFSDEEPYKIFSDVEDTHSQVDDAQVNARIDELLSGSSNGETLMRADSFICTTVGWGNFFSQEEIPNANDTCADKIEVLKYSNAQAKQFEGKTDGVDLSDSDYFYLYFRAYPNLDMYADLVDDISGIMPCVIQFGLIISLRVDNQVN